MPERPETAAQRRAMLRGALVACIAAAVVIGGLAVIDGGGDDPTPTGTLASGAAVVSSTSAPVGAAVTTIAITPTSTLVPVGTSTITVVSPPVATLPSTTTVVATSTSSIVPAETTAPIVTSLAAAPDVDAAAYVVVDASTGALLAEADADDPRPVGSVMKLLTAYVVMQAGDPEHVVTVPALDLDPEESAIGLYEGEQLSRAVLLRAMMIVSANDAARSLAVDIGGSQEGFVQMMNQAAAALGLRDTVAANPIGLDADGAHSTARDLATLATLLMQDETFRTTVARTSASLHGQTFASTNAAFLTGFAGADGVKTGHTTQAGWCLAASASRDGRRIVAVVLGSSSDEARVSAAETLLDWAFAQTG